MTMLSNSIQPSVFVDEGTVVQVDPIRMLCKVRTLRGQMLQSVRWLVPFGGSSRAGDRLSPSMGDRVMLEHGLGNPVIIGFFPRLQGVDGATPLAISSGDTAIDTGSYSQDSQYVIADQNKPKDLVQGDRLISTVGGALLGLLRGGSILIRSSRVSEIFLSKFSGLVRVVSRNWEHFTDVSSDVVRNFNGRVYRYIGYARSFVQAKNEDYSLNFFYGDVAAAEAVKTRYHTYTGTPTTNNLVYKEQIIGDLDNGGSVSDEIMRRTLAVTGEEEVWITNGEIFAKVTTGPAGLTLNLNDEHSLTIDADQIAIERSDGASIVMTADGITHTFEDGTIEFTSDNITTTKGTSTCNVSDNEVSLEVGSHFCRVNASGVQLG